MTDRLPVAGPWITEHEIAYVTDAVSTNWYGKANDYLQRFEVAFAEATQRRHGISLPSCTSAIHLALAALDIGPGDEVIVPDLTWIASSAPVTYVGATPVFADVDPETWCLSPQSVELAITPRTRAIVPVDLYGGMVDYAELLPIAAEHGIPVIEDAAEAVGAEFHGSPAGAFGLASVFSFHGSKTLTTGEGGMLVTDDDAFAEQVRILRDHGRMPGDRLFFNDRIGFKYKMSSMQAALGLAQLERLDELIERKRQIFGWYRDRLDGAVGLNAEPPGTRNAYWMVTAIVPVDRGLRTADLMRGFDAEGIDTRPFFHPLTSIPAYQHHASTAGARERNPVSYAISGRGINLPSALSLTEADVDRVSSCLLKMLEA